MSIELDETIKNFSEDYESNPGAVRKGIAIFKSGAIIYEIRLRWLCACCTG